MNKTIKEFYTSQDKDPDYIKNYDIEHGPRLDAIIERFNLKELKYKKLVDIGGGCGFLGKRLDSSNKYIIVDGAYIPKEKLNTDFQFLEADLNTEWTIINYNGDLNTKYFPADVSFCFEVLEHLENPYRCLVETKKATEENGYIYLSIPDVSVTHNTIYPGLIYPANNFVQFLEQMALPIKDYFLFNKGWKTHIFKCLNADWKQSKMLFPKVEEKFIGKTPLEYTNL